MSNCPKALLGNYLENNGGHLDTASCGGNGG